MNFFDKFLDAVEFIRPKYMVPFITALSMSISILLAPLSKDSFYHEFKEPANEAFAGETMEIDSDYVIVIGEQASEAEKYASQKLQQYLKQIAGAELSIVTDAEEPTEKEIIIGKTSREGNGYSVDRTELGDDGIFIKTVGKKIVLSGAEKRGAVYSVYNFLEKYFDCHWFAPDCTEIPKAEKLIIPQSISYAYAPKLSYRHTDWMTELSTEYKIANGLNNNISEQYGGGMSYAGSFCHTMADLVDKNLISTEPEVFALGVLSGERTTNQLCLSNPRTLELVIQGVRRWLEGHPNAQIVSVTQNDNQDYCVCENCAKIDEEAGSHAGTMLRFANAVADDIKEDYPNAFVDTFAYQYTRKPPVNVTARDNVIVRLCSIECHFSTPLNSGDSEPNKAFAEDIKEWKKLCKNLHIWDYTTNYSSYLTPYPNFDVLQDNIKFFIENNVIGIYEEGNYDAAKANGEFANLRMYLLSKLLWNPDSDVDKLIYDFCKAYYGEGYQSIIDFINYIDKNSGFGIRMTNWWITPFPNTLKISKGVSIYENAASPNLLRASKRDVKKLDGLWETAKKGAKTPEQLEHVERSEICWRYWKACNAQSEFKGEGRLEENIRLYEDLKKFNITMLHESIGSNGGYINPDPDMTLIPNRWDYDHYVQK